MRASSQVCPKCKGNMVQGFMADFTHHVTQATVSNWIEGPPQKSFWTGTKAPKKKRIPVGTFRCSSCGYLESYARAEFERQ